MKQPPENVAGTYDAPIPSEMAEKAESVGIKKATGESQHLFALAILAGAFIALGSIYYTTVTAGTASWPYGVQRLLGGLVFSLGLILVVVGGGELFTGNTLLIMAWADQKITTRQLLRNWGIVYGGNFVGSFLTAALMYQSRQWTFGQGAVGLTALSIANHKSGLDFFQALTLGVLCNALVCLAVWLTYSARSTTDKILAILFPISAFVAAGFEHSVANMYLIPIGLFIRTGAPEAFWQTIGKTAADFPHLTWKNFLFNNLMPVTIGNIIGGAVLVGAMYWFIYLRKSSNRP